jgi:hypothetical protein
MNRNNLKIYDEYLQSEEYKKKLRDKKRREFWADVVRYLWVLFILIVVIALNVLRYNACMEFAGNFWFCFLR